MSAWGSVCLCRGLERNTQHPGPGISRKSSQLLPNGLPQTGLWLQPNKDQGGQRKERGWEAGDAGHGAGAAGEGPASWLPC